MSENVAVALGDIVERIDRSPHYNGRRGTVIAAASPVRRRFKTELRILVEWEPINGRKTRTFVAVDAQNKRWKKVPA